MGKDILAGGDEAWGQSASCLWDEYVDIGRSFSEGFVEYGCYRYSGGS
jgi:hypothetical protein